MIAKTVSGLQESLGFGFIAYGMDGFRNYFNDIDFLELGVRQKRI